MIKQFEFFKFFVYFSKKNVSIKSVFNVCNEHSSFIRKFNSFVKKMERRFQKRRVLPGSSTMFSFRRVKSDSVVNQ